MAAVKKKGLTDEEIGLIVDRKRLQAVGVGSSKLAEEREKVTRYYDAELPKPQHKGQSTYVSSDVYDAIEAMKADLLETFGGSQDIGQFEPQGPQDAEPCRIATDYCSYLIYRKNPGWSIFHDIIDDSLKARVGIVKVYWDEQKETEEEEFEGQDEDVVQALAAQEDIEELLAEQGEDGTYAGTLTRVVANRSQVRIEVIQPENFGIESQAKDLSAFHFHMELMTKDELEAAGYDVSKLAEMKPDANERVDASIETEARFKQVDSGFTPEDSEDQDDLKHYKVYECYIHLKKSGSDYARLYRVVRVGSETLDCTPVDRSPFKAFVALRRAHSFWGNNFAKRVMPTQNARTVLTRGILDHTSQTLNPRHTVLQGGLTNPREMLDNRLGGLVNITRPDAVRPLEQANLNPFVYQTLEMLKANKEETTGTSSLAQGLNKDAISSQNSQGMVQGLIDLSKQRAMVVARNFAEFLRELYIEVYRLVLENEDRQEVVELAGNWVDINPKAWVERKSFKVNFHLGKNATAQEAMKYQGLLAAAASDPALRRMVGENGAYNASVKVMTLNGIRDIDNFITHPSKIPPPPPDPEVELRKAEMQTQIQIQQAKGIEAQAKAELEREKARLETIRLQIEVEKARAELELARADSHRKDMQIANEIDISQREIAIVEAAPAVEPAKAIVSPNS